MGNAPDPAVIERYLTPLLSDPSNRVRGNVAVVLWSNHFERLVIDRLREMLQSEQWQDRASAIYAFGEIGSLPAAIHLLTDTIREGRHLKEQALEPYRELASLVYAALGDPTPDVVRQAIYALGKMGERNAILPIYRILTNENYPFLKQAVTESFEKIGISIQDMKTILTPFERV